MFNDILFIDQNEAIEAELLFARRCLIVPKTLIADLVARLTHMAVANLHKRNGRILIKRLLIQLFCQLLLRLLLTFTVLGILFCHPMLVTQFAMCDCKYKLSNSVFKFSFIFFLLF